MTLLTTLDACIQHMAAVQHSYTCTTCIPSLLGIAAKQNATVAFMLEYLPTLEVPPISGVSNSK
jgi:hypothetical protein